MHTGSVGCHRLLGIGADAADMRSVTQGVDGAAAVARHLDRPLRRLARDDLAVAHLTVEHRYSAVLLHALDVLVGAEVATSPVPDIGGYHADAVARMPFQVRVDRVVGTIPTPSDALPMAVNMSSVSSRSRW